MAQVPRIVTTGFITSAKTPLLRAEPIYRDVAAGHGIRWELLAACDWMQCQAQPRPSRWCWSVAGIEVQWRTASRPWARAWRWRWSPATWINAQA